MEKGKKGHLNPAFHLKVVGPVNKLSGHKAVRVLCVLVCVCVCTCVSLSVSVCAREPKKHNDHNRFQIFIFHPQLSGAASQPD